MAGRRPALRRAANELSDLGRQTRRVPLPLAPAVRLLTVCCPACCGQTKAHRYTVHGIARVLERLNSALHIRCTTPQLRLRLSLPALECGRPSNIEALPNVTAARLDSSCRPAGARIEADLDARDSGIGPRPSPAPHAEELAAIEPECPHETRLRRDACRLSASRAARVRSSGR